MNTLYVRYQTKDYMLDIVAARAGMRINKVNSVFYITLLLLTIKYPDINFYQILTK